MKKSNSLLVAIIIFTLSIIFPSISSAQTPAKYWIAFKDKAHSTFSIGHPEEYLSQQALNKRHHFHIAITEEDLPVNQNYIDSILQLDTSNLLLTKSKWLNGITIYTTDSLFENKAKRFDFVTFIDKTISLKEQEVFKTDTQRLYKEIKFPENIDKSKKETSEYNFTKTFPIANLNHSQWLYRMGYTGKGMVMMV
ncbi:MAG: hypothetical protein MJZ76_09375, partial [Bacteroidales bacterium]|nr:hypothetical protein [Bacteroidales bacterium]